MFYKNVYRFYEYISPHLKYSTPVEEGIRTNKIVVMAAHPDDESIAAGGTIAKAVKSGIYVRAVFITMDEERRAEYKEAMKILGVFDYTSFNQKIKNIDEKYVTQKLINELNDIKPDVIISPAPIDTHLDHRITSKILRNALKELNLNCIVYLYSIWLPAIPNVLIDVSGVYEIKKSAINAYASQIKTRDYIKISTSIDSYWAEIKNRGGYLEPFLRLTSKAYLSFIRNL